MRVIGRLLLVTAFIAPVGAGTGAARATVIDVAQKCTHFQDAMRISPGLTNTPTSQVFEFHGRVYGCSKAGGSGSFSGSFSLGGATCATLSQLSAGTSVSFAWRNGTRSNTALRFRVAPGNPEKAAVSGNVVGGSAFVGFYVQSEVHLKKRFAKKGAHCSPEAPLQRLSFTNSRSLRFAEPLPPPPPATPRSTTTTSTTTTSTTTTSTTTTSTTTTTTPPVAGVEPRPPATPSPPASPPHGPSGLLTWMGSTLTMLIGLAVLLLTAAYLLLGPGRAPRSRSARSKSWLYVTLPAGSDRLS